MRRRAPAALALVVVAWAASCGTAELSRGKDLYNEAVARKADNPEAARALFREAAASLEHALARGHLHDEERVQPIVLAARCRLELGEFALAERLLDHGASVLARLPQHERLPGDEALFGLVDAEYHERLARQALEIDERTPPALAAVKIDSAADELLEAVGRLTGVENRTDDPQLRRYIHYRQAKARHELAKVEMLRATRENYRERYEAALVQIRIAQDVVERERTSGLLTLHEELQSLATYLEADRRLVEQELGD